MRSCASFFLTVVRLVQVCIKMQYQTKLACVDHLATRALWSGTITNSTFYFLGKLSLLYFKFIKILLFRIAISGLHSGMKQINWKKSDGQFNVQGYWRWKGDLNTGGMWYRCVSWLLTRYPLIIMIDCISVNWVHSVTTVWRPMKQISRTSIFLTLSATHDMFRWHFFVPQKGLLVIFLSSFKTVVIIYYADLSGLN